MAIILRPFYTETGRRICLSLIETELIFPKCIDCDDFNSSLEEPQGKTMMKSLDATTQVLEWREILRDFSSIESFAFNEAKPNLLKHDLDRIYRAYKRTVDAKWRGLTST